jgi:putative aminopeptidase FrvX
MTETQALLEALLSAPGVSGDEGPAALAAKALLPAAQWVKISPVGSLIAQLSPPRPNKSCLLLTAHLDQIGLVVTHPPEKGFVRASCVGGVDRRMAAGARVEIDTPQGPLPGVVTSTPPHLQSGEPKLPESTLLIDLGGLPEDESLHPRPGMTGRFMLEPTRLLGTRYTAPALDNRAGCAAVVAGALGLSARSPDFGVILALTAAEETGGRAVPPPLLGWT